MVQAASVVQGQVRQASRLHHGLKLSLRHLRRLLQARRLHVGEAALPQGAGQRRRLLDLAA